MDSAIDREIENWLCELAAGRGRDGLLTGHQRHFLRVIDGISMAVREEKRWLAFLRARRRDIEELAAKRNGGPAVVAEAPAVGAMSSGRGYAERLEARQMYLQAQANQVAIGGGGTSSESLVDVRSDRQLSGPPDIAAEAVTEEEQILYVFGTAWIWWRLAQVNDQSGSAVKKAFRKMGGFFQKAGDASGRVGEAVTGSVEWVSGSIETAAQALGSSSERTQRAATERLRVNAHDARVDATERAVDRVVAGAAGATNTGAGVVADAASAASRHAGIAGKLAEGFAKGASGLMQGAVDAVGYSEEDIQKLKHEVEVARTSCLRQRELFEQGAMELSRANRTDARLEQFTIGGLLLSEVLAGKAVPPDVQAAYEAAFPAESLHMDFAEKAASMASGEQMLGLVNAVKGKLFELKYLDELNAELMPQGLHASLASSATQPGWDIEVLDQHGQLVELLSLKATAHVGYVQHALERYPDIDVVSTSEVYASLAGTPFGAHVIDGGIENVELSDHVGQSADGGVDSLTHAGLSLLALLPAVYKYVVSSKGSAADKAGGLSEHVGRVKAAGFAGATAMWLVPYWPAALLAAMGVSHLARIGGNRREQAKRLTIVRDALRAESGRLADRCRLTR